MELPFRQIHLDYHTSEALDPIADQFAADDFADSLVAANVNSVTCFARCHHGWIYYQTRCSPERRHPGLSFDLLERQVEACHARGIRVPVYTSVQWDHYATNHHPEWLCRTSKGDWTGNAPLEAGFYHDLCLNSPYRDWLEQHVSEILELIPADGLFFDIVRPVDCVCPHCLRRMRDQGFDPQDVAHRQQFSDNTVHEFKVAMSAHVRECAPSCGIFYNAGHIGPRDRSSVGAYSHFEVESLPGGEWGYSHFPATIRYVRTLGLDCVGHTGRFHGSWGDFHSYKNLAALRFECLRMLAQGTKCLIGDQLLPNGRLDRNAYRLIGEVYKEVEAKEPWCRDVRPVVQIGVVTPELSMRLEVGQLPGSLRAACSILEQGSHLFDVLDWESDFSKYEAIVLPDEVTLDSATARKLETYAAEGGAVIASFNAALDARRERFLTKIFGVNADSTESQTQNQSPVCGAFYERGDYCEYLVPSPSLASRLPEIEHAMYRRGIHCEAEEGTEILGRIVRSYFDRTYAHFCSHRQTPSSGHVSHPGIVQRGRCIYFSSALFLQYDDCATRWCKVLVLEALQRVLDRPIISHNGPSTLRVTVNERELPHQWIIHLLHFMPERRASRMEVIEDVIPLSDLTLQVHTTGKVKSVTAFSTGNKLSFEVGASVLKIHVPRVDGHEMVTLQWV